MVGGWGQNTMGDQRNYPRPERSPLIRLAGGSVVMINCQTMTKRNRLSQGVPGNRVLAVCHG